jgi:hypothetical protein
MAFGMPKPTKGPKGLSMRKPVASKFQKEPWYESNLLWGSVSLFLAIVFTVIAAMVKDLRWLLLLALPFGCLALWSVTNKLIESRRTRWIVNTLGWAALAVSLVYLNATLKPDLEDGTRATLRRTGVRLFPREYRSEDDGSPYGKVDAAITLKNTGKLSIVPAAIIRAKVYVASFPGLNEEGESVLLFGNALNDGCGRLTQYQTIHEGDEVTLDCPSRQMLKPVEWQNFKNGGMVVYVVTEAIFQDKYGGRQVQSCTFYEQANVNREHYCKGHNDTIELPPG